jgi:hypothetical protein
MKNRCELNLIAVLNCLAYDHKQVITINEDPLFPMTVEIILPPVGYCFALSKLNADGDVETTFIIPRGPIDNISHEEIECVNIRDE